jgi:hypothetical protein
LHHFTKKVKAVHEKDSLGLIPSSQVKQLNSLLVQKQKRAGFDGDRVGIDYVRGVYLMKPIDVVISSHVGK